MEAGRRRAFLALRVFRASGEGDNPPKTAVDPASSRESQGGFQRWFAKLRAEGGPLPLPRGLCRAAVTPTCPECEPQLQLLGTAAAHCLACPPARGQKEKDCFAGLWSP